jgi:mannose-6-phosphate isomerase-like protein (cupin superfamily)
VRVISGEAKILMQVPADNNHDTTEERPMQKTLTRTAAALALTLSSFTFTQTSQAADGAPLVQTFLSAAEVQALIAHAREIRKDEPLIAQPILSLAPYRANLEYRAATGPAAVHETEAEMFYVIEGSATLTTGGKLAGETRTNPTNLSGTGIEGGESRPVAKGDFFIVPEGEPHQYTDIQGELVLMSLHVPRG